MLVGPATEQEQGGCRMSDKKQYEKPVLESCGTMTEQTRGASYNNGGSLPTYREPPKNV